MSRPIVVAVTGASGAVYAVRLLDVLLSSGHEVHLSISPSGAQVMQQELSVSVDLEAFDPARLWSGGRLGELFGEQFRMPNAPAERLQYHHWQDYMSPIASGSFLTAGMIVCPCSGATLSAIAAGATGNLIQRAAEVHLKERRPLVLVPRETPLSLPHIDNMRRVTEAGATVLPAAPGWYHGVESLGDLVDFIVSRICDQLRVENTLIHRWGDRTSK